MIPMKKTLWSHDFIIITLGTLISAIGSTAMSFALSLVVFDHTSSTLMTGIFTAISLMPTVQFPFWQHRWSMAAAESA